MVGCEHVGPGGLGVQRLRPKPQFRVYGLG